jgi:Protein of unknown function (DUF2783)
MTRIDAPNSLADPDAFFEALVALHDGLDVEHSLALDARLILLMAQQIGDDAVLRELLAAAAGAVREH